MTSPLGPAVPGASGFDRVVCRDGAGATRSWSRAEFQRLPLLDRVRLLAGGELRFLRGENEVPAQEALRSL
jgi:hypothetical protein